MKAAIMGGTSGIGLATAERLMAAGAEVTVTGRDEGRLAKIRDQVTNAVRLDGTDERQVAAFFEQQGEVDHLVLAFSPGAIALGPLADLSTENIRAAFDGKLFGYLHAIRHAKVTDSITLIGAASARAALPGTVALAGANGAIERMVPPLAVELAPVRVNAVSPGVIDTDWWSELPEDVRRAQFAEFAAALPVGRIGRPEDVADAIVYLIGATFVTGQILAVDGGGTVG